MAEQIARHQMPEVGQLVRVRGKRGWWKPKPVTGRLQMGMLEVTIDGHVHRAGGMSVQVRGLGWRPLYSDDEGLYVYAEVTNG